MKPYHWLIAAGISLAVIGGVFWSGWTARGWQEAAAVSELPKEPQTKPLKPDTLVTVTYVSEPGSVTYVAETLKVVDTLYRESRTPVYSAVFGNRFPHRGDSVAVFGKDSVRLTPFDFFAHSPSNSVSGLFSSRRPLLMIQGEVWTDGRLSASATVPLKGVWRIGATVDDQGGKGLVVGIGL